MYPFSGPAEVRGFYQNIRNILQPLLILIFIGTPWISINHQPMILFDVFERHFVFFGERFYSHDAPLLFFVLILIVLIIFIITALFGRLWCGWCCPQTVFLHSLFNKIEKLILGNYSQRYQLFSSEGSLLKKYKILAVYLVFFALSWILAHSFVAYFLGADTVTKYIFEGPAQHLSAFITLSICTLILFFNFTFFREKLCFIVCPYGRFQSALIDRNSLTVFYDTLRGEPRGKISAGTVNDGHCIDCKRCVRVCPTKIDIRNGFQYECIACGKCVDACNEVMFRTQQPQHLIRYEAGNGKKITLKRFRLALYAVLFLVFFTGFIHTLINREPMDFSIVRAPLNPFGLRLENDHKIIQNQVLLHLKNQTENSITAYVFLSDKNTKDGFRLSTPAAVLPLAAGKDIKIPAFIEIDETRYIEDNNTIEIILNADRSQLKRGIKFIRIH